GAEIQQPLETVVAVDDTAVQVVEVAGREAATVELHHRAQFGRDHRHDVEDHRLRVVEAAAVVVALVERGDDLQALDGLLTALRRQRLAAAGVVVDGAAQLDLFDVEVDAVDQRLDRVGTGATLEVVAVAVTQFAPQKLVVDDQTAVETLELVPRAGQQVELHLVALADAGELLVEGVARLAGVRAFGLGLLCLCLGVLDATIDRDVELLADGVALFDVLGFEVGQVLVTGILVDPRDEVGREVDDLLELLGLQLFLRLDAGEEIGQPAARAAQVPDVHDRRAELDVAHALTANLGT